MRQVASIEELYQSHKDIADFFIIYIKEAHASDSKRPVGYAKELGIKNHTTYVERCTVAQRLIEEKKLNIPCLIDSLDNKVNKNYKGSPTRLFLIRKDGRLGVAGKRGPWGLKPAFEEAQQWLEEYQSTGKEPALKK